MKVFYNSLIPFRGFTAINLFGRVFARREFEPVSDRIIRHEAIHTAQMRETGYVGFYPLYLAEWLWRWARLKDATAAYRAIRFEREAYGHQDELDYLAYRRPFAWTRERSL